MKRAAILGLVALFGFARASEATNVSGTISSNTQWTVAGSPYIVTANLTVDAAATLTIDPGVTVKAAQGVKITIAGTLSAVGTAASPIVITGNVSSAGYWWGLVFASGAAPSASQLSYVTVSYGNYGSSAGNIEVQGSSPSFDHVTCSQSSNWGLYVSGASANPTVTNSTFSNNVRAIDVASGAALTLRDSAITNNSYALLAYTGSRYLDLSGLTVTGNGSGGAWNGVYYRGGTMTANETWPAGLPWIVTANTTVGAGATWNVAPGATVKVAQGVWLDIVGTMSALGTAASPISIVGNSATPGYWFGIAFESGAAPSASRLTYVTVSHGNYGGASKGNIEVRGSSPVFDHLTSSASGNWGLYVSGATASPTVTNSTFTGNQRAIDVDPGSTLTLRDSVITNNSYALLAYPGSKYLDLSGLTVTGNGSGGAWNGVYYRGGTITGSETWPAGLPWIVTADTAVAAGSTWTVLPGATVKVAPAKTVTISGTLNAVGTSASPISFVGNGGNWSGLVFGSAASASRLTYVAVSQGNFSVNNKANLEVQGSSPVFDHVTSSSSGNWGLYVSGATASPTVTNSTFTGNPGVGVEVVAGASLTIRDSTITNNGWAMAASPGTKLLDLGGLTVTGNGGGAWNSVYYRGGTMTANEAWPAGIPWVVTAATTVGSGATWTLAPGAVVKVAQGLGLAVNGTMSALGTTTSPITITANTATPSPGYWFGLVFGAGSGPSASQLDYVTVSYGGYSVNSRGNIEFQSSSPTLTHVTSSNSSSWGMCASGTGANPLITNSTFVGNAAGGVGNASPLYPIRAPLNYWNSASGPGGVAGGPGQALSTGVQYEPWLTAAPTQPHFVASAAVTNRTFSPSLNVLANLGFTSSQQGDWTVSILDGGGGTIRTFTGNGTTGSVVWDGKNTGGVVQPGGTYRYLLASTATSGGQVAASAKGTFVLDAVRVMPPVLAITDPTPGQVLSNVYQNGNANYPIGLTATTLDLSSWVLEYGTGASPTQWLALASGTSPVTAFNYSWATLLLANGGYVLRLRSSDSAGNGQVVQVPIAIANFSVTQSVEQFSLAAGGAVGYSSLVPFPVSETIVLKDLSGATVRTLVNGAARAAGSYQDIWNGTRDSGVVVPDGPYFYFATVTDGSHTMTWDLSTQYLNNGSGYNDNLNIQAWDPFNNKPMKFDYNFPQPGTVTIAFSPTSPVPANCNPPQWCMLNRHFEPSGPHAVIWAGVDDTGALRTDIRSVAIIYERTTFSKNLVMVFGGKPVVTNLKVLPAVFGPAVGTQTVELDVASYQNQPVTVSVSFQNQESRSTLRTVTVSSQAAGHVSIPWNGRADNGMLVAPGAYTVAALVSDSAGNQVAAQILSTILY